MSTYEPLWKRYERSISVLLSSLESHAPRALHNQLVDGRLSQSKRQVDVFIEGSIIGGRIAVVVECKRHRRLADIGTVDQLIGKVLDIGAERGVIYSYSGFTPAAVRRAMSAKNPSIIAIALKSPEILVSSGVPGHPSDLVTSTPEEPEKPDWGPPPQWVDEMDRDAFASFLIDGSWSKFWS